MRKLILAPLFAAVVTLGAPGVAMAATNDQNGLVNVNLQDIAVAIPVSVAVPIGVAANVCDVSVLSLQDQTGDMTCTATNNSTALSRAIAVALTDPNGGGGANNQQSGLVNVNVQDLALAVPVSVAVPVGIAANVCGVSVLSLHEQTGDMTCDAENTSTALTQAIARAIAGQ
jgi:hypothetical protein